jgi:hypothetical protein
MYQKHLSLILAKATIVARGLTLQIKKYEGPGKFGTCLSLTEAFLSPFTFFHLSPGGHDNEMSST